METFTLPGNPPVTILLRQSARARRMSLRVSQLDGRVTLTVPAGTPLAQAQGFARDKALWLRRHLDAQAPQVTVGWGVDVPVAGALHRVVPGTERGVRQVAPDRLEVSGPMERVPAKLQAWIKTVARDRLASACDFYADRLGRGYTRLSLRDTRSRWGSCTADGGLMFSWRLIFAPPQVLDYVAAHEVAHLAHMDHSPRYWAVVQRIYGDPDPERRWLRENGASLHRYRFEN